MITSIDNVSSIDNILFYRKDNGTRYVFKITDIDHDDWRKSLGLKLIKVEHENNDFNVSDLQLSKKELLDIYKAYDEIKQYKYGYYLSNLGIIKSTTIDFIVLKNMGVTDTMLALKNNIVSYKNVSIRTLQNRLRLARQRNWIPKPTSGAKLYKVEL
jgi:hypothetical protein